MSEYWNEEEQTWEFPRPRHFVHQRKAFEGHYPDKNEAKLLRRIMAKTGLTEAEVRNRKKYRVMLSETQKPKVGLALDCERFFKRLVKQATVTTKLATKHPKTLKEIEELLKGKSGMMRWFNGRHIDCNYCNHLLTELKKN